MKFLRAWIVFLLAFSAPPLYAASYYPLKPDDPSLIELTREKFPALHADGITDDSATLQDAVNQAATHGSILLIPPGRYCLAHTVGIPPATRLIGYGPTRPVFVLPPNTPGFADNPPQYMIWFTGGTRRRSAGTTPATTTAPAFSDASAGTFYSGLINIDFDIADGNPAAAAIRARFAQHGLIAHCDFNLRSAYAALDEVGNFANDLHVHGGTYGIISTGTSPSWQYTILDSSFDGQTIAAFKTHNTGLTLIRDTIANTPTAVAIDLRRDERLWMSDCTLQNISAQALIIGHENNERTQINLQNIACAKVPQLAFYAESKKFLAAGRGDNYRINQFTYGLQMPDLSDVPAILQTYKSEDLVPSDTALPVESDIRPLPPMDTWVNLRTLGAKGDGTTDDLPAFKAAIEKNKTIFLPAGRYRVSDTIHLQPDTVLIGLSPITTQIAIDDSAQVFNPPAAFHGVLDTPDGGENIIQSIGIDSGANNARAVGIKWQAGEKSMLTDVKFLGGHGTWIPGAPRAQRGGGPYNADHSADSNPNRKWSSEGPSLWITAGGGTFANIWTASTFNSAGVLIENTSTRGHIYELSSEHHVHNEITFHNASNWSIFAQQTEEEWGESEACLPVEIDNCSDLLFANTILFRVFGMNTPFPTGIQISDSHDLRFRGIRTYGQSPYNFDNSLIDSTLHMPVRSREIALVDVSGDPPAPRDVPRSPLIAPGATLLTAGDGFFSIDHAVVDGDGTVYFVDMHENKIFKYLPDSNQLSVLRNDPIAPFALALDHAGNLLILSHQGKAFALPLSDPNKNLIELQSAAAAPHPNMTAWIPTDRWWDHDGYFLDTVSRREPLQFISPDATAFIPIPADFGSGRQHNWTIQPIDLYRKNQLGPVQSGQTFYAADENAHQTWRFTANDDGTLKDGQLFAQHGEAGVISDAAGNVYICEGDIFVYDAGGNPIDRLTTPTRPLSIVFCGKNRDTLFIAARTAAYTLKLKVTAAP